MRIDAHQHYWCYCPQQYPWITEGLARLKQDFLPHTLQPLLAGQQLDGSISVQACHSMVETQQLLQWAEESDGVNAVVGWVDIQSPDLETHLETLHHPLLKGFRHQVQDENDPGGWQHQPVVSRGIKLLQQREYIWEMLVNWRDLSETARFAAQHDNHWLVLDHLGKPDIARGASEWGKQIAPFAALPHVVCKLSGLVTENPFGQDNHDVLRPFIEEALARFGPTRLMFGSDWPVCLLTAEYDETCQLIQQEIKRLSPTDQDSIWGTTAARIYGLTGGSNGSVFKK